MFRNTLLFISFVLLHSCKEINNKQDDLHQIINLNFFQFVDSSAYQSGKLIQIPFNNENTIIPKRICILVDSIQMPPNRVLSSIKVILQKISSKEYKELLSNKYSVKVDTIELSRIVNTGKFNLQKLSEIKNSECKSIAGKLTFYTPYISNTLALITYNVSVSAKAGITKLKFFKKIDGLWKQVQEVEIERW